MVIVLNVIVNKPYTTGYGYGGLPGYNTACGTAEYGGGNYNGYCVRYACDTSNGLHPGNGQCANCHDTWYSYSNGVPSTSQKYNYYDCLTSSGYFYWTFQSYEDIIYNPPVIAAGTGVLLLSASPPALAVLTPLGAAAPGTLGATSVAGGGGGILPSLAGGGFVPTAALAVREGLLCILGLIRYLKNLVLFSHFTFQPFVFSRIQSYWQKYHHWWQA